MIDINWEEFKEFKKTSHKDDNFEMLLDFMKSYYNMTASMDIYSVLVNDGIGEMMLQKRDIVDAQSLQKYLN